MWWMIGAGTLAVAFGVAVTWFVWEDAEVIPSVSVGLLTFLMSLAFLLGPSLFLCKATWGSVPGYDVGERAGYLTKLSRQGLIWKTHEAELQSGVGELAALQAPWKVSVPDRAVRVMMSPFVGSTSRVRIRYRGWLMQPYRRGESGYEAVGFEVIE